MFYCNSPHDNEAAHLEQLDQSSFISRHTTRNDLCPHLLNRPFSGEGRS